jgi:pyruvate dehydrogenase E1 component alpha subunit
VPLVRFSCAAHRGDGPFLEMKRTVIDTYVRCTTEKFVQKEEVEEYKKIDPLHKFYHGQINMLPKRRLKLLNKRVKELVQECVDFAEESDYPPVQQL